MGATTASLHTRDAHELGDLTGGDVDGRASHESANGRQGDEFNNPTKAGEAKKGDDGASNDSESGGNDVGRDIRKLLTSYGDDVASNLGHDSHGLHGFGQYHVVC